MRAWVLFYNTGRFNIMTKIKPGIFQLQIPIPHNPLHCTNDYLLKGSDGYLLIDTGVDTDEALAAMKAQIAEVGVDLKDISQIVVTHAHGDHYGLIARLKELTPARVLLHSLDAQHIGNHKNTEERLHEMEQWLHTNGAPDELMPLFMQRMKSWSFPAPDVILQGNETISNGVVNLQVIWTPGHSPGHICLYEPVQKILFCGDHVLPVITPNISFWPGISVNPLGDFIDSLQKVKLMDVALVLPAHERTFTDLPARVKEILAHHELRNSEIIATINKEPKTAYQIASEITWMPELGGTRFPNLTPWDRRMAMSETLAHLEAMRVKGRLSQVSVNSYVCYLYGSSK